MSNDPFESNWSGWNASSEPGSPHRFQERHSPTAPVKLRLGAQRTQESATRRLLDARLWEGLTNAQQDAAMEIAQAFHWLTGSQGYKKMNLLRIPGARRPEDFSAAAADTSKTYFSWARLCGQQKLSHAMTIDILAMGFSCREVDRTRRQRRGTARQNLALCLDLYCQLRGWTTR